MGIIVCKNILQNGFFPIPIWYSKVWFSHYVDKELKLPGRVWIILFSMTTVVTQYNLQVFQTKINASQISNGNESLFQAETEMFRLSVSPLGFDSVDGQLSKWSESKGIYEVKQQRFSVSGFVLNLKRISTPFLTNTYFPTGLLTIISFIGFVIPVDIVPGRMALLVTIFLMLVNTSSTERSRGPKVNRNDKRIDRIL